MDLQHRFRQADVSCCDDGEVLIVLFVHHVADIGGGDVQLRFRLDLHGLRDGAHRKRDVLANCLRSLQRDARIHGRLEAGMIDRDGVHAQHERWCGVGTGAVGGQRSLDGCTFIAHFDFGARDCGTGRFGDDASNDAAIGSLGEKGTTQAEGNEYSRQPHNKVGSHRDAPDVRFPTKRVNACCMAAHATPDPIDLSRKI